MNSENLKKPFQHNETLTRIYALLLLLVLPLIFVVHGFILALHDRNMRQMFRDCIDIIINGFNNDTSK